MNKYQRFKRRLYEIIWQSKKGDKASSIFDITLCSLVILSCIAVVIELFNISDQLRYILETFEYVTVGIFIVEYLLRAWLSEYEYPECKNKLHSLWEYITSFDSLIDILSIVSILFNQIPKELAFLRLIKLIKLVRLVKMSDYIKSSDKTHEKMEKVKIRVNEIIDKGHEGDVVSKVYDIISVTLVLLSVSFLLVETFPIPDIVHEILYILEIIIAVVFAVEYVLRVWTAPLEYPHIKRPDKARMKYIFSFMSLIDILSIVPVFVANLPTTMGILKIFKLCKVLRLVKVSRYLSSIANFGKALQMKKKQIVFSIIAIAILISITSVIMYSFENKAQPDVFVHGFVGIEYCLLSLLQTETNIAPVTQIGEILAAIMTLLAGCMLGVPIAIISSGFGSMIQEQAGDKEGTKLHEAIEKYDALSDDDKKRFVSLIKKDEETF